MLQCGVVGMVAGRFRQAPVYVQPLEDLAGSGIDPFATTGDHDGGRAKQPLKAFAGSRGVASVQLHRYRETVDEVNFVSLLGASEGADGWGEYQRFAIIGGKPGSDNGIGNDAVQSGAVDLAADDIGRRPFPELQKCPERHVGSLDLHTRTACGRRYQLPLPRALAVRSPHSYSVPHRPQPGNDRGELVVLLRRQSRRPLQPCNEF